MAIVGMIHCCRVFDFCGNDGELHIQITVSQPTIQASVMRTLVINCTSFASRTRFEMFQFFSCFRNSLKKSYMTLEREVESPKTCPRALTKPSSKRSQAGEWKIYKGVELITSRWCLTSYLLLANCI